MKFLIPVLAACAVLSACATATPYQPAVNSNGGYQNQKIESNRWAISFSGNTVTDRQTVETYMLYHAAELTTQNGFDNFQIVSRETDTQSRFIADGFSSPFLYNFYGFGPHVGFNRGGFRPSGFSRFGRGGFGRAGFGGGFGPGFGGGFGRGFGQGFHDPFFGGPSSFSEQVNYEATAEIIMHKGVKQNDAAFFNAEDVLTNLADAIILPET